VKRNRIKRRLREVVRNAFPRLAQPGHDYVVIGRPACRELPYAELSRWMDKGLRHLHRQAGREHRA